MGIAEVCVREVATISSTASLREAALVMRERHVGTLVAVDGRSDGPSPADEHKTPVGILTDRDIVVAVIAVPGARPEGIRVCDVMAVPPVTIFEGAGIGEAVNAMAGQGVRRLCVVDARGRLTGILSADDVLRAVAKELDGLVGAMQGAARRELSSRKTLRA